MLETSLTTETDKDQAATKETKTAVAEAATTQIYVGPNIPKEGLNRFRVYKNGTPKHFEQLFSACPTVKNLFVDIDKLSTILKQLDQTGSAYHTWYATVTDYVKGV
ncbi:hypothetical protein Ga0466249_002804 [Sporomusaceae bacterium BoRhaA]|uniref:hypothetical protein n=1 Tax=Pelorhabdus rhamnosifermentans TaxID=2772457 RepID=UPI001C061403|nr:hypothetical protein [Pelorhabdus rhamnosifermentans]MBU2701685.1 hypothetical protein [Pelorhabdus rhamnosifermentans]